jgi:hypothetical protein
MTEYLFQTDEFGVSDKGIHLLRSGFNYQIVHWNEINFMKIKHGKELQNWWIIFLLGTALLVLGLYWSIRTVDILLHKEHAERYAKMLLFLLIPGIGIYFLYNAFRTGPVLRVNYSAYKKATFPLRKIMQEDRLGEFKSLAAEKLGRKIVDSR